MRFTSIITNLREQRKTLLEESKKKKRRGSRSNKPTKRSKTLSFDSPELETLFNSMPRELQDLIKKGE